jgi:hypothetical protein
VVELRVKQRSSVRPPYERLSDALLLAWIFTLITLWALAAEAPNAAPPTLVDPSVRWQEENDAALSTRAVSVAGKIGTHVSTMSRSLLMSTPEPRNSPAGKGVFGVFGALCASRLHLECGPSPDIVHVTWSVPARTDANHGRRPLPVADEHPGSSCNVNVFAAEHPGSSCSSSCPQHQRLF